MEFLNNYILRERSLKLRLLHNEPPANFYMLHLIHVPSNYSTTSTQNPSEEASGFLVNPRRSPAQVLTVLTLHVT